MIVEYIPLTTSDDAELLRISTDWSLSLNLDEMKRIQEYFRGLRREPSDLELNTLAQTWSEHCVHKTFKGIINYNGKRIDGLLKSYIMKSTESLEKPWCICVFEDNAGIIGFDDNYDLAFKVETHNHPTALDPYGGAGTGSGGVFRDVMGVGAKPMLSTDILFFGPLDYPHEKLPKGTMHPKRLMKGAVAGIRDYGNRMGIPTANGGIGFDDGYICNPLVFAGCLGIMPKRKYIRDPRPGDRVMLAGGLTGRDGIHGVTFASLELTVESETISSGAVQIGNPIMEKKVLDGLMKARDQYEKPLYTAITDCGGGGLSSAIGEMGNKIGVTVDLDKVPLKEEGLKPWEIWISESQERMVLAVPPPNVEKILEIFDDESCPARVIGVFDDSKKLRVRFNAEVVGDLDMLFLHKGLPRVERTASWRMTRHPSLSLKEKQDYASDLKNILYSPNVSSKEWIIRQYDHEVQAHTIIKPLCGKGYGPSDACVLKPLDNKWRGVVVSCGFNPYYSSDPYNMALSAIDEAIRNNICCGGRRIALLDNFSWGNPEKPDTLGQLVEAVKACYEAALNLDTPFISGKDSLYNEYTLEGGDTISIPPTLVISAVGIIPDVRKTVTMDLKQVGDPIYITGLTLDDMGGSHYHLVNNVQGGKVPSVDLKIAKNYFDAIIEAIDAGIVRACHDCSEGGIGVAVSEMAFAGEWGLEIWLNRVPSASIRKNYTMLFSESNSRFIIEVDKKERNRFEEILEGLAFAEIGEVAKEKTLNVYGLEGNPIIQEEVKTLQNAWRGHITG